MPLFGACAVVVEAAVVVEDVVAVECTNEGKFGKEGSVVLDAFVLSCCLK